ncbi:MAG: radical SAM protein [Planctomycetes bacterium]|nr:radical SAM protein [Planctomycetota bacterium]
MKATAPPPTKSVSLGANTLLATSRGCPFNCGFCATRVVWDKKVRSRSKDNIIEEIQECVHKYGISTFHFTDELFTSNRRRVWELCEAILEMHLNIKWVCTARAQGLDLETLKLMKRAGCHEISFGIESGNQTMLNSIDKHLDLKKAADIISLTKKAGIITHATYMFGYIGETEQTMQETLDFAKSLNTHVAGFFIASPLPGTPLYEEASQKGYLRKSATWIDYSPLSNQKSVLELPTLSTYKIRSFHRNALKKYYTRPSYIWLRLKGIRRWHDIVNLFGGLRLLFKIKK